MAMTSAEKTRAHRERKRLLASMGDTQHEPRVDHKGIPYGQPCDPEMGLPDYVIRLGRHLYDTLRRKTIFKWEVDDIQYLRNSK